jgi:hypothetical protein
LFSKNFFFANTTAKNFINYVLLSLLLIIRNFEPELQGSSAEVAVTLQLNQGG